MPFHKRTRKSICVRLRLKVNLDEQGTPAYVHLADVGQPHGNLSVQCIHLLGSIAAGYWNHLSVIFDSDFATTLFPL
jgi:hypothetical protein